MSTGTDENAGQTNRDRGETKFWKKSEQRSKFSNMFHVTGFL